MAGTGGGIAAVTVLRPVERDKEIVETRITQPWASQFTTRMLAYVLVQPPSTTSVCPVT
jgi:hypothetical protein